VRMAAISVANIKLAGSHCGVSIGEDGPSQMALEDLAIFRAISGTTVLYPADAVSAERAVELAAHHQGMVFIRTSRPKTTMLYDNNQAFAIGKAHVLRQSDQDRLTVVSAGVTVFEALKAYEELKAQGILIRVVDLFSIKPIDTAALVESARRSQNRILTVEEHNLDGGLGDAVAAAVAPEGIRVFKVGVHEVPRSGKAEELLERYGLSGRRIAEKVRGLVK
jgi:transketolase